MTISSSLRYLRGAAAGTAILAAVSCADIARTGNGPTYLIVQSVQGLGGGGASTLTPSLESDVQVGGVAFRDIGEATVSVQMKNTQLNATAPTPLQSVTINRYQVRFRRTDGQNREGIDVPFGFEGGTTVTIAAGGTGVVQFDLVRAQSKLEAPLRALSGGGGLLIISTIAEVTFYGRDQAGNEVSVSGTIDVRFGDF